MTTPPPPLPLTPSFSFPWSGVTKTVVTILHIGYTLGCVNLGGLTPLVVPGTPKDNLVSQIILITVSHHYTSPLTRKNAIHSLVLFYLDVFMRKEDEPPK